MADLQPFFVDRAKGGRASCKGCKGNCPSGELRIAKVVASPYGENQTMKSWHHVDCFMNALLKQRPATKRVDSIDDIGNWETLSKEDQEFLIKKFNETEKLYEEKYSGKYTAKVLKNESAPKNIPASSPANQSKNLKKEQEIVTEDNKFNNFFKLCKKISKVDAYTEKTATVNNFFTKGTDGESFKGDLALWCKLLLPQVCKRVYNLKSKQLVKLFSRIFNLDHDDMLTHLEQGDVAETIQHFFSKSRSVTPASESTLTIHNIEDFLQELSTLTKEEEQTYHFKKIVKKCTENDLKMLIRLIKGDLRINAGPKHILEGVHPDAYTAFQTSRDLNMVIERILSDSTGIKHKDAIQKSVKAKITIMTPVLPMLAEACKSVEMAMKKCPNGMFSEIKYDGERVQVHKKGNEFKYFSRALKPVMPHKVSHFKDYLPQAFPKGEDMILDAEVLMVDVNTGKPLPFGTLGIHKQSEFKDAQVCLFIFDCLYYNGQVLLDVPIRKRRKFLLENMVEVKNHIMFSEQQLIKKPADLAKMIAEVLQLGLEGLVLKDLESTYEPGKRHWLKVKKDYLFDGKMADTADLVVLGAWFGTGKKGGMMSVFLMGCLDKRRNKWVTVTKVHTGHDDSTLERLQKELNPLMSKISQDYHKVPSWLDCNKGMVPDYVAIDPKKQPVWEITGTEFTKANIHTADGISVRFPRVTKIRDDKNWESATNLDELKHLFKTSKEKTDVSLLNKIAATATDESQNKKVKEEKSPVKNKGKDKLSPKGMGTLDSFVIKKESKKIKEESSSKKVSLESSLDTKNNSFESDTKKGKLKEIKSERLSSDESMNESVDHNKKKDRDSKKRKLKEIKDEKSSSNDDINDSTSDRKKDKDSKKRKLKYLEESSSFKDFDEVDSKKKRKLKDSKDESSDSIDSDRKKDSKKRKSKHDESSSRKSDKESKKDKRKSDQLKISDSSSDTIIYDLDDNVIGDKDIADQDVIDDVTSDKDITADKDVTADKDIIDDEDDIGYPENPFPDLFLDKRLGFYPDFISFTEEERDIYERHWIAYGGIVVKTIKYMDVDYVLHRDEEISLKDMKLLRKKIPDGVIHVNKFWLNKCINDLECVDTKHYAVFVNP